MRMPPPFGGACLVSPTKTNTLFLVNSNVHIYLGNDASSLLLFVCSISGHDEFVGKIYSVKIVSLMHIVHLLRFEKQC